MKSVVTFATPSEGAVHLTHVTQDALLEDVETDLRNRNGFALATLNLDHIVKLRRDPAFHAAYLAQTHVVADGNPIVWLSRLAGRKVELVPGSEAIVPLTALAARLNVPIAFLGSTPETLDAAGTALKAQFPGLKVVAAIAPPYGFDPEGEAAAAALSEIAASGAGLCFLALGAPKQEALAARGLSLAPNCGFVSIGAGLDFISGQQKRAPVWVQRIAMEWFWRMVSNPSRLAGRYIACLAILPGLMLTARRDRVNAQRSKKHIV